jgi:hypothetical protein
MEANVLSFADKRQAMTVIPRSLRGLIGQVLGERIRVDEVLGVGGMGVVFRGYHLSMDCPVAVKIALPQLGVGELVRFRREAELGGRLDHPNCINVFELSTSANGQHYMVMPLLEGRPLTAYLTERLTAEQVASWGIQLLRGIAHAHGHGIIHRDIKPDNVMVCFDESGEPLIKIVDFGLAKPRVDAAGVGVNSNTTMTGLMAGTPAYMAPEQALGLGCDERSDVYSIGMVLHQMAVGYLPYTDDDAYDQLRSRLTSEVPALPGSVPAPLAQIIEKALRGKKEHRYATADAMREDLEAFLAGASLPHAGIEALPPPPMAADMPVSVSDAPPEEAEVPSTPLPIPVVQVRAVEITGAQPIVEPERRGRAGVVVLGMVAILAAAAVPVAMHYSAELEAVTGLGSAKQAESAPPKLDEPPASKAEANALDEQLAPLVDVESLTDAERLAAAQLAFANRDDAPCGTFAEGLAFVERSHSKELLELLPRVGVPEGEGCEGLSERVTAALGEKPVTTPEPVEIAIEPEPEAPIEPAKVSTPAREPRATKRGTNKRSEPRARAGEPKPTPAKPAGASAPKKLPAAPRLDDGLRKPTFK